MSEWTGTIFQIEIDDRASQYMELEMEKALVVMQVIVGLGILNVWLVRRNWPTPFRGGSAKTMKEEFNQYGIAAWMVPVVGFFKVSLALLILAGFFIPQLVAIGSSGLAIFMAVAVVMHLKIRDGLLKTVPAILMLIMCCLLAIGSSPDIVTVATGF